MNINKLLSGITPETIMKFDFLADNIASFKSIMPINGETIKVEEGEFQNVYKLKIEVFIEDLASLEIFDYDNISEILDRYKVHTIYTSELSGQWEQPIYQVGYDIAIKLEI